MRKTSWLLVVLAVLTVGVLAAACAAEEPKAKTVTIEGIDFAFTKAPQTIEAGLTTLVLKNVGKQPHILSLVRLEQGKTLQDVLTTLQEQPGAPPPSWATVVGGPGAINPGSSSNATVVLAPGTHVMVCFVPDAADGKPHFAKGMIGSFNVTGKAEKVELPKSAATVSMKEFAFTMPALSKGSTTVRVVNEGQQLHEFEVFKLAPGKTPLDVAAFFSGPPSGPPPFEFAGGVSGLTKGLAANLQLDLTAGNYVAICAVTDPATKKPHAELGMVASFTIQ